MLRAIVIASLLASLAGMPWSGVGAAWAQCQPQELDRLIAFDWGDEGDLYGHCLALDGDVAVIGAVVDDHYANSSGAAYVFRLDGVQWAFEQKLLMPEGQDFDYFAKSVAISGDVIVVGMPGDDDLAPNAGAGVVFRFDGWHWVREAKLLAADGLEDDRAGVAVAVAGDVAVVGAYNEDRDDDTSNNGAAYVYRFDGGSWTEEAKLLASDAASFDWFGYRLAMSGDRILAGAPYDDDAGSKSGSAYVFHYDGAEWVEEAKLVADDALAMARFGGAVAIDGQRAVVGAHAHQEGDMETGAAYVFQFDGVNWVQEQQLLASDGQAYDEFGGEVAIAGDIVLVGALLDDDLGENSGSAYVFCRDGASWIEELKLLAPDGVAYDYFGSGVAVSGGVAACKAWVEDDQGDTYGMAYVFGSLGDCNVNGTLDLCDIATGVSDDADGDGIPDECELPQGDLNGDGRVDFFDLEPFVDALGGEVQFRTHYPHGRWLNADCNDDGDVTFADIDGFVARLLGG